MKTLNRYKVEITLKVGIIGKVGNVFTQEKVEILAENEHRFCLNNEQFTTIEKKKSDFKWSVNNPSISSYVNDTCFGTQITYNLYSDKDKRIKTIAKEIQEYIDNKFKAFANVDLSFLESEK